MYLVAITFGLGASSGARAQTEGQPTPGPPAGLTFHHKYQGGIRGNVTRLSMGNRYTATLRRGTAFSSITTLSVDKATYRLQDRRDDTKNASSNLILMIMPGLNLTGSVSDNRFFNRVVTLSNALQDFQNDVQRASADLTYVKLFMPGMTMNLGTNAAVSKSEQTFLRESSKEGSVKGRIQYNIGGRLTVSGGGYLRKTDSEALTGTVLNKGLGLSEDSLTTTAKLKLSPTTSFEADYARYTYESQFMDLPRGVFLEQQFSEDLRREVETRDGESITLSAQLAPVPGVSMNMSAEHSETTTDFAIAQLRFRHLVTDRLYGKLTYTMGERTNADVTLERREVLNDLGPQSLGSFLDRRRSVKFNLNTKMLRSLSVTMQAGTSLIQTFYVSFDVNPRDRDQLDRYANIRLSSDPFPKVNAGVYLSVLRTEFVNIDGSLSQDNRSETTYDMRPEFTYRFNDRLSIRQTYGINIEFTEYDFTESDNFLDRNFTFTNTLRLKLAKALTSEIYYQLRLHDRGSYLRPAPDAERELRITQEDRRDQMTISFRYQINPNLTLLGKNDYSQRTDRLRTGGGNAFRDGGLEVGVEGNYDFGPDRALKLRMLRVKRYGRFNNPAQEDYWVMDSSLTYAF